MAGCKKILLMLGVVILMNNLLDKDALNGKRKCWRWGGGSRNFNINENLKDCFFDRIRN